MASQIQFDISISASAPIVAAIGSANLLLNGSFESFESLTPFLPSDWVLLPLPPGPGSPVFGPETSTVFDEIKSLKWSHDGIGQRPSIQQIITAQTYMDGKTMKVTGKIRSSTSDKQTLSMSVGINGVGTPTLVLPNGSQNENIETPETGVVFNLEYDNQQWYDFDFYYHVPESGIFSLGPVLFPTATDSTTEVYLDDVRMFFEITNRSESWRIDLEPIDNLLYGYGYGYSYDFINVGDPIDLTDLSYFNVFGILGDYEGIGYNNTVTNIDLPSEFVDAGYQYGFGYESGPFFKADGEDTITVRATVFENNIRQPNIRVVFKASPFVTLSPHSTTTDAFGEAFCNVSFNSDVSQNTLRQPGNTVLSNVSFNGFLSIFCEIDKNPEEEEGIFLIQTSSVQVTNTSLNILDIGTYGFGKRTYGYGYNYGYGYTPNNFDINDLFFIS